MGEREVVDQPYVTRRPHGQFPAGSPCLVTRTHSGLLLKFADGTELELSNHFFAEGLENPPRFNDAAAAGSISEAVMHEMMRIRFGSSRLAERPAEFRASFFSRPDPPGRFCWMVLGDERCTKTPGHTGSCGQEEEEDLRDMLSEKCQRDMDTQITDQLVTEKEKQMDKYAVVEGADQEALEKRALAGCPKCGSRVEKHGTTLTCPKCGTEPFEPETK
jgi:ribosomal protein S27AE